MDGALWEGAGSSQSNVKGKNGSQKFLERLRT